MIQRYGMRSVLGGASVPSAADVDLNDVCGAR